MMTISVNNQCSTNHLLFNPKDIVMAVTVRGSTSPMRRLLGPILSLLLIGGVGIGIWFSASSAFQARQVVTIRGLIGSEKEEFFRDERVIAALRRNQLEVNIEKAGSREISAKLSEGEYDFGFPAGVPAAEKIRFEHSGSKAYDVFFTPMAVASWKPIADILVANGIAKNEGAYYTLDMAKYLDLVAREVRWSELTNNEAYNVNKRVLITSTDIRRSNSAAMYLALSSYVLNGNRIVQSGYSNELVSQLEQLFFEQGFTEYSSEAPFEDYLVMGMGKAPMVMIYEAQFITQTVRASSTLSSDMVLIYPEPSIFTKHILVAFTPGAERLGEALENDEELQKLAIEYGLRNSNIAYQREFWEQHNIQLPQNLINVIEPPTYEVVEGIIQQIEAKYN
jgi:hypothetical protein